MRRLGPLWAACFSQTRGKVYPTGGFHHLVSNEASFSVIIIATLTLMHLLYIKNDMEMHMETCCIV